VAQVKAIDNAGNTPDLLGQREYTPSRVKHLSMPVFSRLRPAADPCGPALSHAL